MRKIAVDYLHEGMIVAKPLYNAAGQILLNAGVALNSRFIRNLKKLAVPAIYIQDRLSEGIEVEDIISDELRSKTVSEIKSVFQKMNQKDRFSLQNVSQVERSLQDIIQELVNNKNVLVNMVDVRSFDDYTYGHSVNVCILSVLTGISLDLSRTALYHLGMGALMHDLGKMQVPKNILNKPGKLTEEEFAVMKGHSTYSYQSLQKQPGISSLSALVAYQHHERYDGSGYPNGLKGEEIHKFSQITGMVDMFDALTADRVYRKAFPVHEACEMISGAGNYYFDYSIIPAFLNNIASYPVGTLVELSSGCLGMVYQVDRGFLANPVVKIITDEAKQRTSPYLLNMAERLDLVISQVITEGQLKKAGVEF